MRSFQVLVPATSANLGPGFDALGLALGLENRVYVEPAASLEIVVRGEGADRLETDERNFIYRAVRLLADHLNRPTPVLRMVCDNGIPLARGLGSSSAALVAGMLITNTWYGNPLSRQELLEVGVAVEGHPDNLAPALFGGVRVCVRRGESVIHLGVPLARPLRAVLFVPDFPMPTAGARHVVPREVTLSETVFNLSRVGLLVAALTTGHYEVLRVATEDALHQKPRELLFPQMPHFFAAAVAAGALGAYLSGAGSTVLALAEPGHEEAIADAFGLVGMEHGVQGTVRVVDVVDQGARVEPAEIPVRGGL